MQPRKVRQNKNAVGGFLKEFSGSQAAFQKHFQNQNRHFMIKTRELQNVFITSKYFLRSKQSPVFDLSGNTKQKNKTLLQNRPANLAYVQTVLTLYDVYILKNYSSRKTNPLCPGCEEQYKNKTSTTIVRGGDEEYRRSLELSSLPQVASALLRSFLASEINGYLEVRALSCR